MMFDPGPMHSTPVKECRKDEEQSVVAQQRREMELLVEELRERDRELNDLVTSHQHQLSMWEQDRQLVLHLQHKCRHLEEDLQQQKKEVVRLQTEVCGNQQMLSQDKLGSMSSDSRRSAVHMEQLQNCNKNLNDSLKQVCTAKGLLEAREEELTTLLNLKENCLTEANKEIKSLRANLKFGEKQREESQVAAEQMANYWQQHCESLKEENEKLLGACQEKDRQLQQATAQLHDTLQQALVLQQALCVSCEREKNKDELLNFVRARQERCNLELNQLKNLYRRQNREMTLLRLNLDTSKERVQETSCVNTDSTLNSSQDTNLADSYMLAVNTSANQQVARTSDQQLNCTNNAVCLGGENTRDTNSEGSHHDDRIKHGANVCKVKGSEHTKDMCQSDNYSQVNSMPDNTEYPSTERHQSPGRSVTNRHQAFLLPVLDQSNLSGESNRGFFKREQDADTEAFWLKIMSLRHGNQNSLPKSAPVKPVQHWLNKPKVEMNLASDQFPVHTNDRVQSPSFSREESYVQSKNLSRGPLEEKCTLPATTTGTNNPDVEDIKKTRGVCPTSSDYTPPHLDRSSFDFMTQDKLVISRGWESQPFCSQLKKSSVLCKDVCGIQPPTPSDSQGHFMKTAASTSHKLQSQSHTEESFRGSKEDGRQSGLKQYSHRKAAVDASLVFEEKLSSFLETPEDDVSIDPLRSQGASSPASKLHRLLLESQEMIKGLELTVHPKNL